MYKIGILFQDREFEHDIYELIRAFYPGSEICSFYEEEEAGCDLYFRIEKQGDSCVIRYEDHENKGVTSAEFIEGQSSDALISCVDADDSEAKERAHAIRKERKDIVKIALYKLLVKLTGKTLPWGNLTGIRIMNLTLDGLKRGEYREIRGDEWKKLNELIRDSSSETVIRTGGQHGNISGRTNKRTGAEAERSGKGILSGRPGDHEQQRVRRTVRSTGKNGKGNRNRSGRQPNC